MFFIIYIAIILLALYLILHDRGEGEGKARRSQRRIDYRPEQPGPVPQTPKPQTPVSPAPKPLEPAPAIKPVAPRPAAPTFRPRNIMERPLTWEFLNTLDYDEDDLVCPFAGQIKATPQGFLWADILIALPESLEYVMEELTEYVDSAGK